MQLPPNFKVLVLVHGKQDLSTSNIKKILSEHEEWELEIFLRCNGNMDYSNYKHQLELQKEKKTTYTTDFLSTIDRPYNLVMTACVGGNGIGNVASQVPDGTRILSLSDDIGRTRVIDYKSIIDSAITAKTHDKNPLGIEPFLRNYLLYGLSQRNYPVLMEGGSGVHIFKEELRKILGQKLPTSVRQKILNSVTDEDDKTLIQVGFKAIEVNKTLDRLSPENELGPCLYIAHAISRNEYESRQSKETARLNLIRAIQDNDYPSLEDALSNGADPSRFVREWKVYEKLEYSPLMYAIIKGASDKICFRLVELATDLNEVDHDNNTALSLAAGHGRANLVERLLKTGKVDLEHQTNRHPWRGLTPLLIACVEGHEAVVSKFLYNSKIRPKFYSPAGHSAMETIARSKSKKKDPLFFIAKMLLLKGADFKNDTTPSGYTPLMYAAICGNTELVKFFIKEGASTTKKYQSSDCSNPSDAYTALSVALDSNANPEIVAILRSYIPIRSIDRLLYVNYKYKDRIYLDPRP